MNEAFVAGSGPPFESVIVYAIWAPAFAAGGALLATPTSADETVRAVEELSFSEFGSLLVV